MVDASVSGKEVVSSEGAGYNSVEFTQANETQRLLDVSTETESIAIRALPNNSGSIFIGFDEDVTVDDGFPILASEVMVIDVDNQNQGIYALSDTVGDELRWIALS